jgi:protection-of-telomeres protein 1
MLPSGFTAINDAKVADTIVSLLGVIVSIKEPRKTRGSDWVLEFTIQDDFSAGTVGRDATINCRLFRPSVDKFPKITGVGDVVLIRNFKLSPWNDRVDAVFTVRSGALVFPSGRIPVPALSQPYQAGTQSLPYSAMYGTKDPTTQEQMAVIRLKDASTGSVQQIQQYSSTAPVRVAAPPDKLSLIKDLDFAKFYDVRAQVVNIYYNNIGAVDLKVTDYTSNENLFLYVDPDDEDYMFQQISWKGPYGQFTLNVTLYGNNASWARDNLAVGDYVYLKNMRTKMSPANKLEGVLHDDRQRVSQVDIRKLVKASDIAEINHRREEHEKGLTKKSAFKQLQNEPSKPSAKISASRKAEKRARQRAQREQEQKEIEEHVEEHEAKRSGVNLNSQYLGNVFNTCTNGYSPSRFSRSSTLNNIRNHLQPTPPCPNTQIQRLYLPIPQLQTPCPCASRGFLPTGARALCALYERSCLGQEVEEAGLDERSTQDSLGMGICLAPRRCQDTTKHCVGEATCFGE